MVLDGETLTATQMRDRALLVNSSKLLLGRSKVHPVLCRIIMIHYHLSYVFDF